MPKKHIGRQIVLTPEKLLFDGDPHSIAEIDVEYIRNERSENNFFKGLDILFDQFRRFFQNRLQASLAFG